LCTGYRFETEDRKQLYLGRALELSSLIECPRSLNSFTQISDGSVEFEDVTFPACCCANVQWYGTNVRSLSAGLQIEL